MNLCKTEQFCVDLRKMLVNESKVTGIQERMARKFRDYEQAVRDKEHQGTIAWLLNEMDEYAKTGRWL